MEPFLGQIQPFGFNFAPRGWAHCDGQLLPIASNSALFSLLGTTFGGDGRTTFGLPELRGRSIRHAGNGPGLAPVSWGQRGGANNVTLSVTNMPSHGHNVAVVVGTNVNAGDESSPRGVIASHPGAFSEDPTSASQLGGVGVTQQNSGGSQPMNIDNPYAGIYYSIAMQGIYPSRN